MSKTSIGRIVMDILYIQSWEYNGTKHLFERRRESDALQKTKNSPKKNKNSLLFFFFPPLLFFCTLPLSPFASKHRLRENGPQPPFEASNISFTVPLAHQSPQKMICKPLLLLPLLVLLRLSIKLLTWQFRRGIERLFASYYYIRLLLPLLLRMVPPPDSIQMRKIRTGILWV